jgi:hypothetical protein
VRVVGRDAEVVSFCGGFGVGEVFCEEVVGGLPLWGDVLVGRGEEGRGDGTEWYLSGTKLQFAKR